MEAHLQLDNSYKAILKMAVPLSISIFIPQLSILANTIFLGHYENTQSGISGSDSLTVMSVAGTFYLVFSTMLYGFSSAVMSFMSRESGKNNPQGIGYYLQLGLKLGFFIAYIFAIAMFFFSDYIFQYFISDPLIKKLSVNFIKIRTWGLPFLFISTLCQLLFLSIGKTKYMLFTALVQTSINILFDYFLIFGHFGFKEYGINGAAYASILAEIIACCFIILFLLLSKNFRSFKIFNWINIPFSNYKLVFTKAGPLLLQYFFSVGAWEIFFIYIEHLGKESSAASQILRSIYGFGGIFIWALAGCANSLVSNLIGQKKLDAVFPSVYKIIRMSMTYAIVICLLIYLFSSKIFLLYTQENVVINLAQESLLSMIFGIGFMSVATIFYNTNIGIGCTKQNMIIELSAIFIYLIYCIVFIEKMRLPLWVAWISEPFYWFLLLLFSLILYRGKNWRKFITY